MSKVVPNCNGFALHWLVIGPKIFATISTNHDLVARAFPRIRQFTCFYFIRSHSFYKLFSFLLIGCWNFFWFWFCVTQSKIAQSQNIEINRQVQVSRELRQIKKTIKTLLSYSTELKCVDINRCVFFSCFSCHF